MAGGPVVTALAGALKVALPAGRVLGVHDLAPVTPLPGAARPIEGVVACAGMPALQIDLAMALTGTTADGGPAGSPGGVVVAVGAAGGTVALRVTAALGLGAADPTVPTIDCDAITAGLVPPPPAAAPVNTPDGSAGRPRSVPLLLVERDGRRIGLRLDGVARVETVEAILPHGAGWLIRCESGLFGAALPERGAASARAWAVLPDQPGPALVVDRLIGLVRVPWTGLRTVILADRTRALFHRVPGDAWTEVMSLGQALGLPPAQPEWGDPPHCLEREPATTATTGRPTGLLLTTGAGVVALPLAAVTQVLEAPVPVMSGRSGMPRRLPVVSLGRLFGNPGAEAAPGSRPLVATAGLVLAIERVDADRMPDSSWGLLPPVPPMAAALFDGIRPAADGTRYLFRLRTRHDPGPAPWRLRRVLAAARVGWVDANHGRHGD